VLVYDVGGDKNGNKISKVKKRIGQKEDKSNEVKSTE